MDHPPSARTFPNRHGANEGSVSGHMKALAFNRCRIIHSKRNEVNGNFRDVELAEVVEISYSLPKIAYACRRVASKDWQV
jgi:hypothetical protein